MVGALVACGASAQQSDSDPPAVESQKPNPKQPPDKRIFGVIPNYRTADGSVPFAPISARQKFIIAGKDSFDWPVYLVSGAFAGLAQIEDQNHSFGQGMQGYAKRYGAAYGDQAIGNMMTEAVVPSLLRQDPRYFRRGTGSGWSRTGYALSRIFVARMDSGRWNFNYAEVLGNAGAVAISNLYSPETRTAGGNAQKLGIQLATDAFSQVLKEFWPDIKHKLFQRHRMEEPAGQ